VAVLALTAAPSPARTTTRCGCGIATGESLLTLAGHTNSVNAVAVLAHGSRAPGSADNTLRLWDLTTGGTLRTLEGAIVTAVAVLADSNRALRLF
jgi:WD40 repeat protein